MENTEQIKTYKCPCCGASLIYKGNALHCDSCSNDFDSETLEQIAEGQNETSGESKFDWAHYEPRDYTDSESTNLSGYTCPSCGAEITGDEAMGATVCPYCGDATIIKSRFEGTLRPDCVIPFKLDKKAAMAAFENDFKNAPFLPDEFKSRKKIEEMAGLYVPFWLFDCDCSAAISYDAHRVKSWSDSDYDYVKTDFFKLYRSGSIAFSNIPVDGSEKVDNAYTEAVEPFNYADAVNFDGAYLSGYLADKYDVTAEDCVPRANERVKNSVESAFRETTGGYSCVTPDSSRIGFSNGKIRYALLPVWMLNIKYMGTNYKFAINGQTGKVVGTYPTDKKKKWRYFGKVAAIGYVIAALIAFWLLH